MDWLDIICNLVLAAGWIRCSFCYQSLKSDYNAQIKKYENLESEFAVAKAQQREWNLYR